MKSVMALVATSVLFLSACASSGGTESAAPQPARNFCDAMAVAAAAAPPAVDALDRLFTTMDAMSAGSFDGDIGALHTAGADTGSSASDYAAMLDEAAALAPAGTVPDVETLSKYWKLYVVELGQIAQTVPSYGSLVDQTTAVQSHDEASTLVMDQPAAQQRVNDAYVAECSDG